MKRTCWSTGNWRSCLSLEVVSSIAARSTMIYRFLWGFIYVSLYQSFKTKPTNMYIARAQFKINKHWWRNWHLCIPEGSLVDQYSLGNDIGYAFFAAISVAWSKRAGQLAAGGVASVMRSWVRSPPVHDNLPVPLWVIMHFPVPEHQNETNKYVYGQRQGALENWQTQVLKLTPVYYRRILSCPVQPRACHWSCVFLRNFSGVKHSCWSTGSWRKCLSLEVVSSIPAGSTIIYRFLCWFICVYLCQSIKN